MRPALLIAALAVTGNALAKPPSVKIEYSPTLDLLCSVLPGSSIKDEWKAEMQARQREFTRLWESAGVRWMQKAEEITGRTFPEPEVTARLTLCNFPSESSPLSDRVTVNMRFALASFARSPVSMRYKVHTLLHELLHLLLFRNPPRNSPLLQQHAGERERVRSHLHLLALQKAVLLQLGEDEALNEVIEVDSALPGGHYKRAWEIVNATEGGYERYVSEIRR